MTMKLDKKAFWRSCIASFFVSFPAALIGFEFSTDILFGYGMYLVWFSALLFIQKSTWMKEEVKKR
jgi:hypothetical protein